MKADDHILKSISKSKYISRDFSWLRFNYRVLGLAKDSKRSVLDRLKFLAITSSNLDEFFMVRVGSLYNYLDYNQVRIDYSGLREEDFRKELLRRIQDFCSEQHQCYKDLRPLFKDNGFKIAKIEELTTLEKQQMTTYFKQFIFPVLTPMSVDNYRTFPMIFNQNVFFALLTRETNRNTTVEKMSFLMIPQTINYFYEVERPNMLLFIPLREIIEIYIQYFFKNVEIVSCNLLRVTRNGEITLDESEDLEIDFIEELRKKLKTRRIGRVVRLECKASYHEGMLQTLMERWDIDRYNVFESEFFINYTGFWQIVNHKRFQQLRPSYKPNRPLNMSDSDDLDIYTKIKAQNIILYHPYTAIKPLLTLLDTASEDPNVVAIKITIYRVAKNSRVIAALKKAVENGKHVSVLFEIKARFDEENNIKAAVMLEKMGCFVIHGFNNVKTHTKVMMIIRREGRSITRYIHLGTGNYNEDTAKLYTDLGFITSQKKYANDVSDFFNVITGHSKAKDYQMLLTSPDNMRHALIKLIRRESAHAKAGSKAQIILKMNSLQDDKFIDALYKASQQGVKIDLIIRGICCLRPGRKGLSENITVRSIVGDHLEHARIYYFYNLGSPTVYSGSADAMVRSFDRRIESLFLLDDESSRKQIINILNFNLKDNVNSHLMKDNGDYEQIQAAKGKDTFNIHRKLFEVDEAIIEQSYRSLVGAPVQ